MLELHALLLGAGLFVSSYIKGAQAASNPVRTQLRGLMPGVIKQLLTPLPH